MSPGTLSTKRYCQEVAMPLIICPTCGRNTSTEPAACPQYDHPNRRSERAAAGPVCYACGHPATSRCCKCRALSCAQHLQSVSVGCGREPASELRCAACCTAAETSNAWVNGCTWGVLIGWLLMLVGALLLRG